MKFEREHDIAAFKGKNWREKWALHNLARERDPWILRLQLLIYFFVFYPIFTASFCLASQFFHHSQFWAAMAISYIAGFPIDMVFHSLFVVPRIRKALDSDTRSAT